MRTGGLAEEQAALRRVATLVARGTPPRDLYAAVTGEVGGLLPVNFAIMGRYEADDRLRVLAASGPPVGSFPMGSRWSLGGRNVSTLVLETGRPARIDDYSDNSSGPVGAAGRERGVRSTVATPIIVQRRLWGVMIVGSTLEHPLPADIEARLAQFTGLLATAVANAESRAGLGRLAEEQAALRRVAVLVARGTPPGDLFAAVIEEAGQLLGAQYAGLNRYEPDGTSMTLAVWGRPGDPVPPRGWQVTIGGMNINTLVFETGRPARLDAYGDATGPHALAAREYGIGSGVGTPIVVEGRLWGLMGVYSPIEQPLPADTEERLGSFTELVATAIANAESRAGLARLAEEQAALRRIATLVARGVAPEELFAAVVEAIGRLLPVEVASMGRYDNDGALTFVANGGSAGEPFPVGSRQPLGGKNLGTTVFETGRPARIDNYAHSSSGTLGAGVRAAGIRSSVATPIIVEGRVWGVIAAGSLEEQLLPPDTEARLAQFTELVAMAIANAESGAALAASRARIVAAADESRRRIERDLHDGAQQRLVHAMIVLKLALRALANAEANAAELVAEALGHAEEANSELRELAHGILPAALTRGGLREGVDALVSRMSLPISVDVSAERLPSGVEATAYFVISEALTNVVKHAQAERATVCARVQSGQLQVEVRDDGIGGAGGGHDTGLGGLEDRVSALDGRLVIESPPGGGTRVSARLPIPNRSD